MGRKSVKFERRAEILQAFAKVLAEHGYAGATMTAVGAAAGVSPGLLHHHFHDKHEMLLELIKAMNVKFSSRFQDRKAEVKDPLVAYLDASLRLDHRSDQAMAKCWVGIFAEAVRDPAVYQAIQTFLNDHLQLIKESSPGKLDDMESSAILAFVIGALVFGAFAPKKSAGFALPNALKLATVLTTY